MSGKEKKRKDELTSGKGSPKLQKTGETKDALPKPNPEALEQQKITPPISRSLFFMAVAELARMKSRDPNTKVGCCIVNSETRQILSLGYNGFFQGLESSAEMWTSDEKDQYLQHAEANAIHFASLTGTLSYYTIFVTMVPCKDCAFALIQKRIGCVICNAGAEAYMPSKEYFDDADIDCG